jgi:virginiamycin B lyase
VALSPILIATAVAGTVTAPWKVRPCVTEYSKGMAGGPLHLALGADGKLYATEAVRGGIVRFDPDTHETREFPLPKGIQPHDIIPGPDGNLWFTALSGEFAKLDPKTGQVTRYRLRSDSEPHDLVWSRGILYIAELRLGRLARFDPKTQAVRDGAWGLPPNNQIHTLIALPNGDVWAALSNANKLARYSPAKRRFDKLVEMPIPNSGPRGIVYVEPQHKLYLTLFAANEFASYDLRTGKIEVYPTGVKPVPIAVANNTAAKNEKLTFISTDADDRYVWASTFAGELFRLDVRTHKVKKVFCGIAFPSGTSGFARDRQGRLWVNEAFPGRIARINP